LLASFFAGCATAPSKTAVVQLPKAPAAVTFHRVEKGQTLWRIALLYGMEVEDLARLNNIVDSAKLEIGQAIMIPADRKARMPGPETAAEEDFIWPLRGRVVCGYGQKAGNAVNKGINIASSHSSEVVAAAGGNVVFYNDNFLDLGKTVIIRHPGGFSTVYGRNREVYVKPGDFVSRGALIAKAGSSGRNKDVYLHFEIRKGSKSENPVFYLP